MKGLMKTIFSQKDRSERLLFDGAICGLIGEAEVVAAARQLSLSTGVTVEAVVLLTTMTAMDDT